VAREVLADSVSFADEVTGFTGEAGEGVPVTAAVQRS
jgi:isoleucyl-tRNA synthetase